MLFISFIYELLERFRHAAEGIRVGERKLSCLGFADDLMIMSERSEGLQELLNTARDYGN